MRKLIVLLMTAVFLLPLFGQDTTKVSVKSEDIAENFDLKAVASAFGEAKDLEEFEKMLNDPEKQLSNLDLNEDGEVDYLRVMETVKGNTHYIAVQAVIGEDKYQDVCSIELEKKDKGEEVVQVVGDTYIYGPDYIYQPVYATPPVIYVYFWAPVYHPWHSPWYWGYRPPYYRPWRPHPVHVYHRNVNVHVNVNVRYTKTNVRYSKNSVNIQQTQRRNDYGKQHPNKSYENRNKANKSQVQNKPVKTQNKAEVKPNQPKSTGREVNSDWKKASERSATPNTGAVGNQKKSPTQQPSNKLGSQPSTQQRQSVQPSTQQKQNLNTKPATQQKQNLNTKPAAQPKTRDASPTRNKKAGGGKAGGRRR